MDPRCRPASDDGWQSERADRLHSHGSRAAAQRPTISASPSVPTDYVRFGACCCPASTIGGSPSVPTDYVRMGACCCPASTIGASWSVPTDYVRMGPCCCPASTIGGSPSVATDYVRMGACCWPASTIGASRSVPTDYVSMGPCCPWPRSLALRRFGPIRAADWVRATVRGFATDQVRSPETGPCHLSSLRW
jgi:hypothetical protein